MLLPAHGGQPFKGEPSQAQQLQQAVTGHPVDAVVVSVGGNDRAQKTEFLDLSHALDGREVCADTDSRATGAEPPTRWGRGP